MRSSSRPEPAGRGPPPGACPGLVTGCSRSYQQAVAAKGDVDVKGKRRPCWSPSSAAKASAAPPPCGSLAAVG